MRTRMRRLSRVIQTGIAAGALIVASAGAALAVRGSGSGAQQTRPFQYSATFHVTAPLDGGVVEVPWPTFGTGRVTFHSNCGAYYNPGNAEIPPYYGMAGLPLAVWNESAERIGLAAQGADAPPNGIFWLHPKGTPDLDAYVFAPGEMVNETSGPYGGGFVLDIAILDRNGTTATGTFAWSANYDEANQVGHCMFSLQLKG